MISVITIIDKSRDLFYSIYGFRLQMDMMKRRQSKAQTRRHRYRVFQKFVPIINCSLRKAFNASLGKCKLSPVRNFSK